MDISKLLDIARGTEVIHLDDVDHFISDLRLKESDTKTHTLIVYDRYEKWCALNRLNPMSYREFNITFSKRFKLVGDRYSQKYFKVDIFHKDGEIWQLRKRKQNGRKKRRQR